MYFVCTTATTIGYGDIVGNTAKEKYFLILLEFAGICIFSAITNNVRNLRTMPQIKEVINNRICEVQNFLFEIDMASDASLAGHIYDSATDYID